jgi:hypothetical protein
VFDPNPSNNSSTAAITAVQPVFSKRLLLLSTFR